MHTLGLMTTLVPMRTNGPTPVEIAYSRTAVLVHLQMVYRQCPEEFQYRRPARHLVETLVRRARPTFAAEVRDAH